MRILEENRSERSRATAVTGLQAARAGTSKQEPRGTALPAAYPLAWGAAARGVVGFIRRCSGTPRGTLKKKKLKTCFASPKFAAHI